MRHPRREKAFKEGRGILEGKFSVWTISGREMFGWDNEAFCGEIFGLDKKCKKFLFSKFESFIFFLAIIGLT